MSGATFATSGSGGPPRPIATTTTLRSRAYNRAACAVIAVFPTRLPVPMIPIEGSGKRLEHGRVEAKVRADVREPGGEHAARKPEALLRPEHRLVREIDDELRPVLGERAVEIVGEDDSVVRVAAQLLGAPNEVRGDELVRQLRQRRPHDRRVVLTVYQSQRARHERVVTSSSIRPVYFSYSKVSSENWMIRSCPWKGCLRQTATWLPDTSTTL